MDRLPEPETLPLLSDVGIGEASSINPIYQAAASYSTIPSSLQDSGKSLTCMPFPVLFLTYL